MKIAFSDFKKGYAHNRAQIDTSLKRVLSSGHLILGQEVENFEKEFALYIGSKYAIGVANGLEALQISLMALDIGEGDEVLTTSLSAVATTLAVKAVGAKPVFVDIDEMYHIDAGKLEKAISKKTKAIIPVHLYGQSADMKRVMAVARKHKLHVIEDCAQAHGAKFFGKKNGSFGIMGCFSFYPTKNLGAYGDGGLITTNSKELATKCRMIRNYGQKNRYEHILYGINSRLDEVQAAILRVLLKNLDKNNDKRRYLAGIYNKELSSITSLELPKLREGAEHVYHLFVINTDQRDKLKEYLASNDISSLIHYPIPIHKQKCFSEFKSVKLPITESASKRVLSLPCHPYLEKKDILYVCQKIKTFFQNDKKI